MLRIYSQNKCVQMFAELKNDAHVHRDVCANADISPKYVHVNVDDAFSSERKFGSFPRLPTSRVRVFFVRWEFVSLSVSVLLTKA